jgi:hypothetical protein
MAKVPVTIYAVDSEDKACMTLKDGVVPQFPTIRYYYDANTYQDYGDDSDQGRSWQSIFAFLTARMAEHGSPAGATNAKSSGETEKYVNIHGRERYTDGGYKVLSQIASRENYGGDYKRLRESYANYMTYEGQPGYNA